MTRDDPNDSDRNNDGASGERRPLDYRSASDDQARPYASLFFGGATCGAVVVFILGFAVAAQSPRPPGGFATLAGLLFLAIAIASLACVDWKKGDWAKPFLAGFLIGVAVAALIEGTCFAAFA